MITADLALQPIPGPPTAQGRGALPVRRPAHSQSLVTGRQRSRRAAPASRARLRTAPGNPPPPVGRPLRPSSVPPSNGGPSLGLVRPALEARKRKTLNGNQKTDHARGNADYHLPGGAAEAAPPFPPRQTAGSVAVTSTRSSISALPREPPLTMFGPPPQRTRFGARSQNRQRRLVR